MRQEVLVLAMLVFACGCEADPEGLGSATKEKPEQVNYELKSLSNGEPSHVTVQHVLIAFDGSLPGQPVHRTKAEAQTLANEVLQRANDGEDFSELVKLYSSDKLPGIYKMGNFDQTTSMNYENPTLSVRPRTQMAKSFGDISFGLDVDEVGMAEFNLSSSPYGWHIIKRIR